MTKGYKVFNPDWTCRGSHFEVGQTYKEDVKPVVRGRGFHFCERAADCFGYYRFNSENKVAEIIALGEVDSDGVNSCTDTIQIVREVPWDELLRIVNTGKDCTGRGNTGDCNTGHCNTGDRNTGDWNTGDCNTGDCNTGDRNTGHYNTGDRNTGHCNTGDCNTGNFNTGGWNPGNRNAGNCNTGDKNTGNFNTGNWNIGNYNTGDWNTGDWNKSSYSTGCFNTAEQKLIMFNKPSDWTHEMWFYSEAKYLLDQIPRKGVQWICSKNMTDEEKAAHPTHETTGGYLKVLNESENAQTWWDGLCECNRSIIKELPNFDAAIFEEITGIRV